MFPAFHLQDEQRPVSYQRPLHQKNKLNAVQHMSLPLSIVHIVCNQEKMHRLSLTSCCVRHLLHHLDPLLNWRQTQQLLITRTVGAYVTAVKMQKLLAIPTSYTLIDLVRSSRQNYVPLSNIHFGTSVFPTEFLLSRRQLRP